jgi:hypothetical protein
VCSETRESASEARGAARLSEEFPRRKLCWTTDSSSRLDATSTYATRVPLEPFASARKRRNLGTARPARTFADDNAALANGRSLFLLPHAVRLALLRHHTCITPILIGRERREKCASAALRPSAGQLAALYMNEPPGGAGPGHSGRVMQAGEMHKSVQVAPLRALIQIVGRACWLVQRAQRSNLSISAPYFEPPNCIQLHLASAGAGAGACAPIKLLELSLCAIIFAFGALRNRKAAQRTSPRPREVHEKLLRRRQSKCKLRAPQPARLAELRARAALQLAPPPIDRLPARR